MPSTQPFAFASPSSATRPLHVLRPEDLAAFLAGIGAPWAGWLTATGFEAGLGELRLLPGTNGELVGAVAGYGTAQA
ncbi:MAG: leucyl aminopeptidase family protein, partial [Tabrizicola sp.]